jgi:hypothetical protein
MIVGGRRNLALCRQHRVHLELRIVNQFRQCSCDHAYVLPVLCIDVAVWIEVINEQVGREG